MLPTGPAMWWEKQHMRFCSRIYKTRVTQSAKTVWLPCCVRVQVIKQFPFSSNCTDFTVLFFMLLLIKMNLLVFTVCFIEFCFSNMKKIFPTLFKTFVFFRREKHTSFSMLSTFKASLSLSKPDMAYCWNLKGSMKIFFHENKSLHLARKKSQLFSKMMSFGKPTVCTNKKRKSHSCNNHAYQQNWTGM